MSVMATSILGDTIDIHGGGADLEFPHHTNEIAQSEAKTGKTFANYWMHNGFVNVDNEKCQNLWQLCDDSRYVETVDGQVLRFFLATQQYRKPVNFTEKLFTMHLLTRYLKIPLPYRLVKQLIQLNLKKNLLILKQLWMMISTRQMVLQLSLTWQNGLIQGIMTK